MISCTGLISPLNHIIWSYWETENLRSSCIRADTSCCSLAVNLGLSPVSRKPPVAEEIQYQTRASRDGFNMFLTLGDGNGWEKTMVYWSFGSVFNKTWDKLNESSSRFFGIWVSLKRLIAEVVQLCDISVQTRGVRPYIAIKSWGRWWWSTRELDGSNVNWLVVSTPMEKY